MVAMRKSNSVINSVIRIKWLERLFFERLEYKSEKILEFYQDNNNDWEATLFKLLIENFGVKINQASFFVNWRKFAI